MRRVGAGAAQRVPEVRRLIVAAAAQEPATAHSTSTAREVTVLKPASYEDVSSVAQSVRAGHIVVLSLRQTDPALSKRVLDFSFGVASALTAQVDCIAEKTFVILQGRELTLEEKHKLAKQGVLKG